jgi:hypothetical protein
MTFFKGDLSKMIVPIGGVLRDAMEAIDRGTRQIALVTDSKGVLVGVITDGDIRRGLMRGLNLQSPLAEITKPNFVSVKASQAATARSLLTTRNLHQIPLVDDVAARRHLPHRQSPGYPRASIAGCYDGLRPWHPPAAPD